MGERQTVGLDERSAEFVATRVADGTYRSAEDVVRAALHLLERRDRLSTALLEGEESGPAEPFDFDAFVGRKRTEAPAG